MKYLKFAGVPILLFLLSSTSSAIVPYKSLRQLVEEAAYIVRGKVVETSSYWNESHTRIYTTVKVRVESYLKGSGGDLIEFRVPGGTVNDTTLWVSDAPQWREGEEVILFLNLHYYYPVVGWFQGKYKVVEGTAVNEIDPSRSMQLKELIRRVREISKERGR